MKAGDGPSDARQEELVSQNLVHCFTHSDEREAMRSREVCKMENESWALHSHHALTDQTIDAMPSAPISFSIVLSYLQLPHNSLGAINDFTSIGGLSIGNVYLVDALLQCLE